MPPTAPPPENGWIPVSTQLPDPSKKVLAYYRNVLDKGRIVVAFWVPANTVQECCDYDSDFTVYNEEDDAFYWPEGWYESVDNWDEISALKIYQGTVTHWMPLPPSPLTPS